MLSTAHNMPEQEIFYPYNRYWGISDDKYYYLTENEDTEEWELHCTDIEQSGPAKFV